jgi:RNA ligase
VEVLEPKLEDILDVDELNALIADGHINVQKHPDLDIYIYNYSKVAQFVWRTIKDWPETAKICRGLIADADGYVLARPFAKFFNMEQHPRSDLVFSKPFTVTEKMDGSLGIMYPVPEPTKYGYKRYQIATRGSFASDQALEANKILEEKYADVVHNLDGYDHLAIMEDGKMHPVTALFEIIYPGNRIVRDYRGVRDLYMLAAIDVATGEDVVFRDRAWPWPIAKEYTAVTCHPRDIRENLGAAEAEDAEGFVLCFDYPKGKKTRVKVKLEEYCRLHRIVTGVSSKTVWEYLKEGKDFKELLERVPDEFYNWVRSTQQALIRQHDELLLTILDEFAAVSKIADGADRKKFAEIAKAAKYTHPIFMLLDKQHDRLDGWIWEQIKPEFSKPFTQDIDA